MVSCPICGTQNQGDFGLINCASCGSPFFIQIDGSAEAVKPTDEMSARAAAEPPPPPAIESMADEASASILEDFEQTNRQSDFNQPPPLAAHVESFSSEPVSEPGDMREIAAFGNSEESLAREGAYRFDLTVMGIDSAEIKIEVKEALSDGRFLWDIEKMFAEMQDGVLQIKDLSAVKSALVVQRLKILPVDIKWEQHAIHQSV